MSVSQCVCAGAHVTQCWAIDLLLAISRICCQDMLGICQLSCFPSCPLPLSLTLSPAQHWLSKVNFGCVSHAHLSSLWPNIICTNIFRCLLPPLAMSCQRLFMPFNKFTLPATVPNTCLLPLLQQCLLSCPVPVPLSKCNFKLALQHHRLHSKLARPKITYRIANASLIQ